MRKVNLERKQGSMSLKNTFTGKHLFLLQNRMIICSLVLSVTFSCHSRPDNRKIRSHDGTVAEKMDSLEVRIREQLAELAAWQYSPSSDAPADNVTGSVKKDLLTYLATQPFPVDSHTVNLQVTSSPDGKIRLYQYAWSWEGSPLSTVHTVLVQWQKSDGSYEAREFDDQVPFDDIYMLPGTGNNHLYLCMGTWRCDVRAECAIACVTELAGDSLNTRYPAFYGKSPSIVFFDDLFSESQHCIACMEYDAGQKEIRIEEMGEKDKIKILYNTSVQDMVPGKSPLRYRFDGKQFVEKP